MMPKRSRERKGSLKREQLEAKIRQSELNQTVGLEPAVCKWLWPRNNEEDGCSVWGMENIMDCEYAADEVSILDARMTGERCPRIDSMLVRETGARYRNGGREDV